MVYTTEEIRKGLSDDFLVGGCQITIIYLDIGEFLTSLLNLARKNDVELPSVVRCV